MLPREITIQWIVFIDSLLGPMNMTHTDCIAKKEVFFMNKKIQESQSENFEYKVVVFYLKDYVKVIYY